MDSSLGQAVGAITSRHEQSRDHHQDDHATLEGVTSPSMDRSSDTDTATAGLPISPGRFELPTELFSVLLKDAQALLPA